MIPSSFHKRPGTTLAGVFSVALASVLLLCGAGSVPIENFMPQGAMQADLNAGNHSITNAATVSGTNVIANSLASTATVNGTNLISNTVGTNKLNFSALPPNGAAAGDLSGSYPNPTVAKINGVTPSGFTAGTTNVAIGGTFPNQAVSVSTAPPAGPAGGDLSGTYPNPTVAKINGATPATVATSGSYNDLSNKPTIPAAQVNSDWNASSGVAQILNKPTIPTALPPNGAAGGDLSGTYPNPTVAKINGVTPSGLVAGANVTISGTFPNQTIAASSGSSSANVTGFRYSAGAGSTDTAATQAQALTLTGIGSIAAGDLVEGQGASAPIGIVPGSGVLSALTNNTDAPSGLVVFNGTSQYPAGSGGLISGLSIPYLNGIGSGVASAMQQTTNGTNGLVVLNGSGNLIALNGANLTSLNASNISSGNLAVSRLSSGTGASSTTFWRGDGTWATPSGGGGSGTVASVGFTGDGTIFNASVTGSPVTTSGTFAPTLANAAQNSVLAGPPSGGAGAPGYQTAPTFSATNLTGVGNSPTALSLTSSSGATTLTRMAAITNLRIFLGAGSYLQQFPLSLTGAQNGDVMNVVLSFPASTGMTAQFYNGTTGGTALLPSPSGTNGVAAYMHTLHFNFDGTAWNLQNDGAVLTKTLGSGEAAALAIAPNTPGGHATISSFSPSGITSLTAKPLLISVGFDRGNGSSQGQMYAMLSTDGGVTWRSRLMNYVDPAPYPVNNIRDVNLWLNKDGTPYRNAQGRYFITYTAGDFGSCGYFGIMSTSDFYKDCTFVAHIPVTGSLAQVTTATVTAASGATTFSFGANPSGLTNGQVYYLSGLTGMPPEAAFVYSSTTGAGPYTIGYQTSSTAITGTIMTTASVSGTASINYANNVWMWGGFIDTDGTMGVMFRYSTSTSGNPYASPGGGYVTFSDPGTFHAYSPFSLVTINSGGTNVAAGINGGSILYAPQLAEYILITDQHHYSTATSARGPYTMVGQLSFSTPYNEEGGTLTCLDGANHWLFYSQQNANAGGAVGDFADYGVSTTGLTGTFTTQSTPTVLGTMSGVGNIAPALLTNTDDVASVLPAFLGPQGNIDLFSSFGNSYIATPDSHLFLGVGEVQTGNFGPGGASTYAPPINIAASGITFTSNYLRFNEPSTVNGGQMIQLNDTTSGTNTQSSGITWLHNNSVTWEWYDAGGKMSLYDNQSGSGTMFNITPVGNGTDTMNMTGYITATKGFAPNTTASSVSGSTSGTASFNEPFTGSGCKKVTFYSNALNGAATFAFPTAFTNAPSTNQINLPSGVTASAISATAVTLTGTGTSGGGSIDGF